MTRLPGYTPCPVDGTACSYPCDKLRHAAMTANRTHQEMADSLGVHRATWHRYRLGKQQPPRAVCVVVAVLQGCLPWDGWQGWQVSPADGLLYAPGLRQGFAAPEIQGLAWVRRNLHLLRSDSPVRGTGPPRSGGPAPWACHMSEQV